MMKSIILVLVLVLVAYSAGCTTVYKAAVDERSIKEIAADTAIKGKIVNAFVKEEKIKTLDIFVASYNGRVYLVGEYTNEGQKNRAIKIANGVEGVKNVTTYFLRKKPNHPCGKKKNAKITVGIKAELAKDTDIWSTNVDVKTIQCTVVLVGLVGSQHEVRESIAHAKAYEGVVSVKSFLRVK